jgi:hypothetical protein
MLELLLDSDEELLLDSELSDELLLLDSETEDEELLELLSAQSRINVSGGSTLIPSHTTEPVNPLPFLSSKVIAPTVSWPIATRLISPDSL